MHDELMARDQREFEKIHPRMKWLSENIEFPKDNPKCKQMRVNLNRLAKETRMTLDLYGVKHETDKASFLLVESKSYDVHDYLRHYEQWFQPIREEHGILLEFGCAGGNSLRLWEDYFPYIEIWGVDLSENSVNYATERTHIVVGDATSQDTCDTLWRGMGDRLPNVIIDDASHAWSDQRRTLELCWEKLVPGGIYIIEDLECGAAGTYAESGYVPSVLDTQPFFDYILDRCRILRWPSHGLKLEERIHSQLPEIAKKIEEELDTCQFIPGAVILRKKIE